MPEVKTIAVIGAGIMGRGIAHVSALGGYRTILEDVLPASLRKAETEIRGNLEKSVELGKVDRARADAAMARLHYAESVEEAAREADFVIEAVPEDMESKMEIFSMLDKMSPAAHHPRHQHLVAQHHRDRFGHHARQSVRGHALLQSRA